MKFSRLFLVLSTTALFSACSNDDDTKVVLPPSEGSQLTLEGGGGTGSPNTVYVDMSADKQTSVQRSSWSLGFYSGSDYRVILNGFTSMSAKVVNKTDIAAVGYGDTTGVTMAIGQGAGTLSMIDDVYGDLTKTVIATVFATESENKVYLIKPESASATDPATWYKIRVTRSSNGYTLQYAKLAETTIKTATIAKATDYNFAFFSLETGTNVTVEPKKAEWDFAWSYAAYFTGPYPYFFSDFVVSNYLSGVQSVRVDSTTIGYSKFTLSDVSGLTFAATRDAIGSNWRTTSPAATAGILGTYYFVVKDPSSNYYKLKFVSMGLNDGGSRGYPVVEYQLVK